MLLEIKIENIKITRKKVQYIILYRRTLDYCIMIVLQKSLSKGIGLCARQKKTEFELHWYRSSLLKIHNNNVTVRGVVKKMTVSPPFW